MKKEVVVTRAKGMLDILTHSVVDFVSELTEELEDSEDGDFDWEIFLNTNMILINGLMHHYIENHLKVFTERNPTEYFDALQDNLNAIKLYYAETNKEIN